MKKSTIWEHAIKLVEDSGGKLKKDGLLHNFDAPLEKIEARFPGALEKWVEGCKAKDDTFNRLVKTLFTFHGNNVYAEPMQGVVGASKEGWQWDPQAKEWTSVRE